MERLGEGIKRFMRRFSVILAAMLMFGLLAACGGGNSDSTATSSTSSSSTSAAATSEATTATSATPATSPTAASTATAGGTPTMGASPSASANRQEPSGSFAYGFNIYARGDDQGTDFNAKTISAVKDAGFNWVRVQVVWSQFERANARPGD
jgi:hypothetical protein